MFKRIVRKATYRLGFTLMEVLVVIGIIGITAAIAIPSMISISNTTKLKQNDDYAKAIYMAAQDNLNHMRASGELGMVDTASEKDSVAFNSPAGNKYRQSYSHGESVSYDLIVPSSLDNAIRKEQVIIEYHPQAGIVYSVFYTEDEKLTELYNNEQQNNIIRGAEGTSDRDRKKLGVGYYSVENVDALEDQAFEVFHTVSEISFENGQEAILTVKVPIQDNQDTTIISDTSHYLAGLEVSLAVTGENGGEFTHTFTKDDVSIGSGKVKSFAYDNNKHIVIEIPLDSLDIDGSFLKNPLNRNEVNNGSLITAGDNVTVTADVTFYPTAYTDEEKQQDPTKKDDPIVMIESATIAGINPMFHSLTRDPNAAADATAPYILAISNGRHLQNLDSLGSPFAGKIKTVVFTHPEEEDEGVPEASQPDASQPQTAAETTGALVLNWSETAEYYKNRDFTPISVTGLKIDGNGVEIQNLSISEATETGSNGQYAAGLFAVIENSTIKNVTLKDPVVITDQAVFTGALAGMAKGTTFDTCSVDCRSDTSSVSGKDTVGGLVGLAEDTAEYTSVFKYCTTYANVKTIQQFPEPTENLPDNTVVLSRTDTQRAGGLVGAANDATELKACESYATVNGADKAENTDEKLMPQQYLGGLVGYASNAAFSGCKANKATVISGKAVGTTDSKNALGGLVGFADESTFSACHSYSATTVTSSQGALSDLGGFAGLANRSTFGTANDSATNACASYALVQGTNTGITNDPIPNNNLGGFVGKSQSSTYYNPAVSLDYQPQYAQDAGGFAGLMFGDTAYNVEVTIEDKSNFDPTQPYTLINFGGIASICGRNEADTELAKVINGKVQLSTVVKNARDKAAGAFADVIEYSKISGVHVQANSIYGATENAGFAVTTGSGVEISYSYFYGTGKLATSGSAGFVYSHSGSSIQCCYASPIMNNGYTFVRENKGTILDCYGWAKGTANTIEIAGKCSYSYFGSCDDNGDTLSMVLYEGLVNDTSQESSNITDTEALTDPWAVDLLNHGTTNKPSWTTGNSSYPYPTLVKYSSGESEVFAHNGHYGNPVIGSYPYALLYRESYGDASTGEILVTFDHNGSVASVTPRNLQKSTITDDKTEFYLCHRTDPDLDEAVLDRNSQNFASAWTQFGLSGTKELYTIYKLDNNSNYSDLKLNTYYPLYNKDGAYRICSADQFARIAESGTFYVDRDITVAKLTGTFKGTLSDTDDVTITAQNGLVNKLTGTLSGLNVTGLEVPMVSTLADGTIKDCTVTANIQAEDDDAGVIAGKMTGGSISICTAAGSVSGSGKVGGVVGYVTDGSISTVTSNVTVEASGENNGGMFIGYAEGGEFTNCKSTVSSTLPFGRFRVVELSNANYSYSQELRQDDLLYAVNLENFSPVTTKPQSIQATVANCWITVGSTEEEAVTGDNVHYYAVNQDDVKFELGISRIATLKDADVTYNDFWDLVKDATDPVTTDCYAVKSGSTIYDRLKVTATYREEIIDGDTVTQPATYTFLFTSVSDNGFSQSIDVLEDDLGSTVANAIPSIKSIEISEKSPLSCTADDGLFLLSANGQYLSSSGLVSDFSTDLESCLWSGNGEGGWYNYKDTEVTASTKKNDTDVSFTSLFTIQIAGQTITTNTFTAQNAARHFGYQYLGTVTQLYDPSIS